MAQSTTKKHPKYYFDSGDVIFLTTDKTLFRLHKCILNLHSVFFRDMFEIKQPPTKDAKGNSVPIDGSSDDNPIELGGHPLATLRDAELESISKVLYEMPLLPATELDIDQASAVLRVASKFQFEAIHQKTIQMLEAAVLPPWKRYTLAMDCLIDNWLFRSYVEICSTVDYPPPNLFVEFARHNETEAVSSLMRIREDYRTKLLAFSYNTGLVHPYPSTSPANTSACGNCLNVFRALLQRILLTGGLSDLDGADSTQFPLLRGRIFKAVEPRTVNALSICANCRPKEKAIVDQVLGTSDLENEVKKIMHINP